MSRMTAAEAVILCRFAKACCPQQAFDEYTPDAWFELLGDLRFDDCKAGVIAVTKRQPFCSPAEIRAAVQAERTYRLRVFGAIEPPGGWFDDTPEGFQREIDWVRDVKERVADGLLTREQYDAERAAVGITGNRKLPELEGVFRRVPSRASYHPMLAEDDKR